MNARYGNVKDGVICLWDINGKTYYTEYKIQVL